MIARRTLLLALLTVSGLALQTAVFGQITLTGTKPELLLLVTVALAMNEGPGFGAVSGFVTGLATDAVLNLPQGLTSLTFTVVGYTVGKVRAHVQRPSAWLPITMVTASTLAGLLLYGAFAIALGAQAASASRLLRAALLAALYNGLLTPFVFPLIRGLATRTRPGAGEVLR
jgi:rod shape-determining protein MreD